MIERTILGALIMGGVGFAFFNFWIKSGWDVASARNALLMLMVLFENVHIGNCRSETKTIFRLSPLRSPVLLVGTVAAFSIHFAMLYIPFGQKILGTMPIPAGLWEVLLGGAATILIGMEAHKWLRNRLKSTDARHK